MLLLSLLYDSFLSLCGYSIYLFTYSFIYLFICLFNLIFDGGVRGGVVVCFIFNECYSTLRSKKVFVELEAQTGSFEMKLI